MHCTYRECYVWGCRGKAVAFLTTSWGWTIHVCQGHCDTLMAAMNGQVQQYPLGTKVGTAVHKRYEGGVE